MASPARPRRTRRHGFRRPLAGHRLAGLAVVVALLTAGCGGDAGGAPSATTSCGEVETPPVQGGEHLLGGQQPPVPYSSTPPTSGWHSSGAFEIAVQPPDDPLTEPEQVSVLEAGGVVVSYAGLSDAERATLADLVRSRYAGRVALTPYDALDEGEVALTAWGVVQRCDAVDVDAIAAFVETYADPDPVTPGAH